MRIVRLALGIWMAIIAVKNIDWIVGLGSIFFLYQAVTDTGCCNTQTCYRPPVTDRNKKNIDEIEFEEVK